MSRRYGVALLLVILLPTTVAAQATVVPKASLLKRMYANGGAQADETAIKTSRGVLVGISARNTNSTTDAFLKCTNLTAANTTPGSSTLYYEFLIPHGGGYIDADINTEFDVALTCYFTTSVADGAAVAVTATEVSANIRYR